MTVGARGKNTERQHWGALSFDGSPWGQVTDGALAKHATVRALMREAYSEGLVWILAGPASWANSVSLSVAMDKPAQYVACTPDVEARLAKLLVSIFQASGRSARGSVEHGVVDEKKLVTQYLGEWGVSGQSSRVGIRSHMTMQWDMQRFNQNNPTIWSGVWSTQRHKIFHFVGNGSELLQEHVHAKDVLVTDSEITDVHRNMPVVRPAHLGMSSVERAEYYMLPRNMCSNTERILMAPVFGMRSGASVKFDMAWMHSMQTSVPPLSSKKRKPTYIQDGPQKYEKHTDGLQKYKIGESSASTMPVRFPVMATTLALVCPCHTRMMPHMTPQSIGFVPASLSSFKDTTTGTPMQGYTSMDFLIMACEAHIQTQSRQTP